MNRHGGRLDIASRLGEGSTFTAQFPAPDITADSGPDSAPDSAAESHVDSAPDPAVE